MEESHDVQMSLDECDLSGDHLADILPPKIDLPPELKNVMSEYQTALEDAWRKVLLEKNERPVAKEPVTIGCEIFRRNSLTSSAFSKNQNRMSNSHTRPRRGVDDRDQEFHSLQQRYDEMKALHHQQNHDLRRERAAAKSRIQELEQKAAQLRSIFIKDEESIPDANVINLFGELNQMVFRLVKKTCHFDNGQPPAFLGSDALARLNKLKHNKSQATSYLIALCRQKIFNILCDNILDYPVFDIGKSYGYLNKCLEGAEIEFRKGLPPKHSKDLTAWRKATLTCTAALADEPIIPGVVAEILSKLLEPLILDSSRKPCLDLCTELCKKAFEVAHIMRLSNDDWAVFWPVEESKLEAAEREKWMEEEKGFTIEGQISEVVDLLSPSLIKRPVDGVPERMVMTKARMVVCRT